MNKDGNLHEEATKPFSQQPNTEDVGDFMSSFRSALSSLDNAQGVGRNVGQTQDMNRSGSMDIMPFDQGASGYQGVRPESFSQAMGLSGTPYIDERLDGVEYEDESHMETGPDYVRMGYSRTMKGRGIYGQRSGLVGVQMMVGPGGVAFRSVRSSRTGVGGGMGGMSGALLLGILGSGMIGLPMSKECHKRYCPIHGTNRHHHGRHHHESEDDGYNGPEIVELSDNDQDPRDKQTLALPAPESSKTGGKIQNEGETKIRRNKNVVHGLTGKVGCDSFEEVNRETETPIDKEIETSSKDTKTSLYLSQTPEKSYLSRKQKETHGSDNRLVYANGSSDKSGKRVEIATDASNLFKAGFSNLIDYTTNGTKSNLQEDRSDDLRLEQKYLEEIERTDSVNENLLMEFKSNEPGTDSCNEITDSDIGPLHFEDSHFGKEVNRQGGIRQMTSTKEENDFGTIELPLGDRDDGASKSNTTKNTKNLTTVKQKELADTKKTSRKKVGQLRVKDGFENETRKENRNVNDSGVIGRISNTFHVVGKQNSFTSKENESHTTEQDQAVQYERNKTFDTCRNIIDWKQNDTLKTEQGQLQRKEDIVVSSKSLVMPENANKTYFGIGVPSKTNGSPATQSPNRGKTQSNHGSEITPNTQKGVDLYQTINSHTPDNMSPGEFVPTLSVQSFDAGESRKTSDEQPSELGPNNKITQKNDKLKNVYQRYVILGKSMSNIPEASTSREVKQNNTLPKLLQNDKVTKEQHKNENKFTKNDSKVLITIKDLPSVTSTTPILSDVNYKMVDKSAEAKTSPTHHASSGAFNSYASRCSSCAKVHVYCECCDAILRTLCGNCEKCRSALSPNSNQSLSRGYVNLPKERNRPYEECRTTKSKVNDDKIHQKTHEERHLQSSERTRDSFHSGSVPDKKPMRNKNATKRSTTIQRPNFTRPNQNTSTSAKMESSHLSGNNNDRYYKSQGSGGDRLSSLTEAMLKEGLVVKDVYPDGNCFFAAIVDQLRVRGEFYYTAKSLRIAAVNYLKANPNQEDGTPLLEFVSDHGSDHGGTWEGYLSRLRKDGEWADHIIICAISSVLKRRILIHSIRRSDQTINRTIMEPDCIIQLRERKQDAKRKVDNSRDLGETTESPEDENKTSNESQADKNKLLEDLLLGHIPEAHYVSLRYLDWEERLFRELRTRIDEPHKIITEYGYPSAEVGQPTTDSIEDREGQPIIYAPSTHSVSRLPTRHNNFLLKYIRNGNCLRLGPFPISSWPKQSETAQSISKMWDVGDRMNDLESYLNLSTSKNYAGVQNSEDLFVEWLIVTPHDCLVTELGTDLDFKYLRPVTSGCKQGFLKLNPVSRYIWSNKVIQENGEFYLKHMHLATDHQNSPSVPIYIGLKSEWPREALACRDRLMRYRHVLRDDVFKTRLLEGVRVVPICSQGHLCHNEDCVEWKYTFSVIECVLSCHIITGVARFCFKILHHFLNYLFADRNIITKEHIKALFFHTCDDLGVGIVEPDFFEIISHFLDKLERFLSNANIPDFFVRPMNLLESIDPEEIRWHHERSYIAKEYYLVYMFLFLDQNGLMERFSLSKCFDSLLFNAFWKRGHNQNLCFERLTILECREWVLEKEFRKAMSLVQMSQFENLSSSSSTGESDFSDEYESDLHKQVLRGIPLQEQWLYAFYLESRAAFPLIQYVNKERDCAKLKEYFGEPAIQLLVLDTCSTLLSSEIELPLDICRQEGIASFAIHFFDCLKKQFGCPTSSFAADASIHYFLCHHTDVLLRDMVPKADEHGTDDRHKRVIDSLFQLFTKLLRSYRTKQISTGLSELVSKLETVTEIEPSAQRYEQLANIWTWIGNTHKSQDALEKANLFRQKFTYNQKSARF